MRNVLARLSIHVSFMNRRLSAVKVNSLQIFIQGKCIKEHKAKYKVILVMWNFLDRKEIKFCGK